jgi:chorismate synthase
MGFTSANAETLVAANAAQASAARIKFVFMIVSRIGPTGLQNADLIGEAMVACVLADHALRHRGK